MEWDNGGVGLARNYQIRIMTFLTFLDMFSSEEVKVLKVTYQILVLTNNKCVIISAFSETVEFQSLEISNTHVEETSRRMVNNIPCVYNVAHKSRYNMPQGN